MKIKQRLNTILEMREYDLGSSERKMIIQVFDHFVIKYINSYLNYNQISITSSQFYEPFSHSQNND